MYIYTGGGVLFGRDALRVACKSSAVNYFYTQSLSLILAGGYFNTVSNLVIDLNKTPR